jgi:hypothetical protein
MEELVSLHSIDSLALIGVLVPSAVDLHKTSTG